MPTQVSLFFHNVSMPTQVSLFHQNCLYADTGVSFPPKCNSTPTQVSMFLQKCLYAKTCVCVPPKVSLRQHRYLFLYFKSVSTQHRCLFSSNSDDTSAKMSLFLQKCLYADTGGSFPPKRVSMQTRVSLFLQKCIYANTGVSFPTKNCLYGDTGVCVPPKVSLRQQRCLFS